MPHAGRAENFPPDVKRYDFNGPVLAISSRTNLPMHFVELSLLPKDIECPMQRNAIDAKGCRSLRKLQAQFFGGTLGGSFGSSFAALAQEREKGR